MLGPQADTFFDKLCQSRDYSNSRLREDSLNLLMDFPYLAEHMNYEVFMPSRVAYGIFRAIRFMAKSGNTKCAHGEIWKNCIGAYSGNILDFALASVSGDKMAAAISQLVGVGDEPYFYWKYGYLVLNWRVCNGIVY